MHLEQFFTLLYHLKGLTYGDLWKMPCAHRIWYIQRLAKQFEEERKQQSRNDGQRSANEAMSDHDREILASTIQKLSSK